MNCWTSEKKSALVYLKTARRKVSWLMPELVYQKSANKRQREGKRKWQQWTFGVKGGGHWRRERTAECRLPHKSSVFFSSVRPLKPRHQNIRSSRLIYDPLCQPLLSTNCGGRGYEIFRIWKRQCRQVCACVRVHVFICALEVVH